MASELRVGDVVITGVSGEDYPAGKVHDLGYAVDFRVPERAPSLFSDMMRFRLGEYSTHYVVLFGEAHWDHIHVGFAWSYAGEA